MDELAGWASTGKSTGKICPSLGPHFLTPQKNVICPSGSISPDKTPYLSADAVYVGGRPLFTLWLEVPIKDRHYNPIRSLVRAPTLEPPSCPNDENDVDDQLALRKWWLCLLLGKDRKHYRLQVLPGGQEGAISGALGGTIAPLMVNSSKQLFSPSTQYPVETGGCQHNSSGFQFPLPSIPSHLYSQIDLDSQERVSYFFRTDRTTNKCRWDLLSLLFSCHRLFSLFVSPFSLVIFGIF